MYYAIGLPIKMGAIKTMKKLLARLWWSIVIFIGGWLGLGILLAWAFNWYGVLNLATNTICRAFGM